MNEINPPQVQSQLSYISSTTGAIYYRLNNLKHELKAVIMQCDPLAFPPEDHGVACNKNTPSGHIAEIMSCQSAIDAELDELVSKIEALKLLVG